MERSPAGGTGTASRPGAVPREPAREGIPNTDHELLARLSRTIDATLRPLIPPDRPVALIDFPQYPNVGDSAIWLGALAVLDRLGLGRPQLRLQRLELLAPVRSSARSAWAPFY